MSVVVLTNAGRSIITNLLGALGGSTPVFLGWGTGTATPTRTDTALQMEVPPTTTARIQGVPTQQTVFSLNDTFQVVGTITAPAGPALSITEMGTFDAMTPPGNLFIHAVFPALTVEPGDTVTFTVAIQFA